MKDIVNGGYKKRMHISCYLLFCDPLVMKSINLDMNFIRSKVYKLLRNLTVMLCTYFIISCQC